MKTNLTRQKTRLAQRLVSKGRANSATKLKLGLALLTAFTTAGFVGCRAEKEIEYPPEVIPDIPPGDRSSEGPAPAE